MPYLEPHVEGIVLKDSLRVVESNMVGGLEHVVVSHIVGNVIIPTDELIFFVRGFFNHQPDHL